MLPLAETLKAGLLYGICCSGDLDWSKGTQLRACYMPCLQKALCLQHTGQECLQ